MDYAQAVARIRVMETKLVNSNQIERILDSKTNQAFFEVLSDSAYSNHFELTNNPFEFQKILDAELIETKEFLVKNSPDPKAFNWLWHKYDLTNIKYAIKTKLANKQISVESLTKLGNISPEDIVKAITEDNKKILPSRLQSTIDKTLKLYEEKKDPKLIDFILDKAYFIRLIELMHSIKSPIIKKYVLSKIDLYNIKLIIRHKHSDTDIKEFEKYIISNKKTISKENILDTYKQDLDKLYKNIKFFDYKKIIQPAVDYYEKNQSFLLLEKLNYDYLIDQLRYARYEPFGIEPLVGFYLAKDNEAKLLRIIMTAKLNNIDTHLVHQLLRKLYLERD